MNAHLKHLLTILLLILIAGGLFYGETKTLRQAAEIEISDRAITHILEGDNRGGGHRYGVGKPCKSEFPKDWNDAEIIRHVQSIAANDNIDWKKQGNGYYTGEQMVGAIRVRVVLNRDRSDVITAYPVNVPRNPCPMRTPANDN